MSMFTLVALKVIAVALVMSPPVLLNVWSEPLLLSTEFSRNVLPVIV